MECSEEFIQLVYDEKHHQVTMISCCNENEQNFWKKKKMSPNRVQGGELLQSYWNHIHSLNIA